jgi:hypothetical protein
MPRMTDTRLIKSSVNPSETNIQDFVVAHVKGRPLVVCATHVHEVWTWDMASDEWVERPLADFDNGAYGIPVYPDFLHVAVAVVDGRVLFAAGGARQGPGLWDLMSGDLLNAPPEFCTWVHGGLAMFQDGQRTVLVAGGSGPAVWVWDPSDDEVEPWGPSDDEYAEEQEPRELPGHGDDVRGLAVGLLRGRPVVVSSSDNILLSDLESGELLHEWSADGLVHAVALSEIGGRPVVLAVMESDETAGEIRVWDAVDGDLIEDFSTGHTDRVSAVDVAVIGDRTIAVTGSDDGTVRVFDLSDGQQIGTPLAHEGEIWTVAVTPLEGRQVVLTAGRGGAVRVWDPLP